MSLDVIVISNFGTESLSGSNPQRLSLEGRIADIQTVINYVKHKGKVVDPIIGSDCENWASTPTLNGLILTSFLNRSGYTSELINDFYREKEKFINALRRSPRLIALSTSFIYTKEHLIHFVKEIRNYAPDAFIVAGGPFVYQSYLIHKRSNEIHYSSKEMKHTYLFFENTQPSIDIYVVSHRGEIILCEVLAYLCKGKSPETIPNIAWYENGIVHFTKRITEDLSNDNYDPNWGEFDESIISSKVIPMQASNGCPYRCAFCNFTSDRRLVFSKSPDQVILELKTAVMRGVKYVWFVDDNFMLGSGDLNNILHQLSDENLGVSWMSFIRANELKNIDFQLLRRAGCVQVQLGLESADSGILHNMQKHADPDTYRIVIENLLKVGINCSCYFIFGFPGETKETAQITRDFIKKIEHFEFDGIMSWSLFPFMLAPLSPIFEEDQRRRYGLTGSLTQWSHATMNSEQAQQEVTETILSCEKSGAIYRSDNMALLEKMTTEQKKAFFILRNNLAKKAMLGNLDRNEAFDSFNYLVPNNIKNV